MSAAKHTPTLDPRGGRCACEWVGDKLKVVCFSHLEAATPSDAFRVFCPKHDEHGARYHRDRPMTDDSCPRCEHDALVAALEEAMPAVLFASSRSALTAEQVNRIVAALKSAKGKA